MNNKNKLNTIALCVLILVLTWSAQDGFLYWAGMLSAGIIGWVVADYVKAYFRS